MALYIWELDTYLTDCQIGKAALLRHSGSVLGLVAFRALPWGKIGSANNAHLSLMAKRSTKDTDKHPNR